MMKRRPNNIVILVIKSLANSPVKKCDLYNKIVTVAVISTITDRYTHTQSLRDKVVYSACIVDSIFLGWV